MKLLSLNICHGGQRRIERLLGRILGAEADVVVLTEFHRDASGDKITAALMANGYTCSSPETASPKNNTVMIASRRRFTVVPLVGLSDSDHPRALLAQFEGFSVFGVYFAQKEDKRSLFNFIMQQGVPLLGPRGVVTGDFNTGKAFSDETGRSFYCIDSFEQLEQSGLVDSWRSRNPEAREFSWYSRPWNNGFRIDHIFSTPAMDQAVTRIGYDHLPRTEKETDHSAMVAEFDL